MIKPDGGTKARASVLWSEMTSNKEAVVRFDLFPNEAVSLDTSEGLNGK